MFEGLSRCWGALDVDLTATDASANKVQTTNDGAGQQLPFFSRRACRGAAEIDVFAQNVPKVPGSSRECFDLCFPPITLVSVAIPYLGERRARAVVICTVVGTWYPRMRVAQGRTILVASAGDENAFTLTHHQRGGEPYVFHKWDMIALEMEFRGRKVRVGI